MTSLGISHACAKHTNQSYTDLAEATSWNVQVLIQKAWATHTNQSCAEKIGQPLLVRTAHRTCAQSFPSSCRKKASHKKRKLKQACHYNSLQFHITLSRSAEAFQISVRVCFFPGDSLKNALVTSRVTRIEKPCCRDLKVAPAW